METTKSKDEQKNVPGSDASGSTGKSDAYFKIWQKPASETKLSNYLCNMKHTPDEEPAPNHGAEHNCERSKELDKYINEFSKNGTSSSAIEEIESAKTMQDVQDNSEKAAQKLIPRNAAAKSNAKKRTIKRNNALNVEDIPDPKDELERLAMEELLKEAKRGAERSETMGPSGWLKRSLKPNKTFLTNTLMSTLSRPFSSNDIKQYDTEQTRVNHGPNLSPQTRRYSNDTTEEPKEDNSNSEDRLKKHDFYYYYMTDEQIKKKLEKKKKSDKVDADPPADNDSRKKHHRHSEKDEIDRYKKHKKRKKSKKYRGHTDDSSCDESHDNGEGAKEVKRGKHGNSQEVDEADSSNVRKHKKKKKHKKSRKKQREPNHNESDDDSLDSWDASNYVTSSANKRDIKPHTSRNSTHSLDRRKNHKHYHSP